MLSVCPHQADEMVSSASTAQAGSGAPELSSPPVPGKRRTTARFPPGPARLEGIIERIIFCNEQTGFVVARFRPHGSRVKRMDRLPIITGTLPGLRAGESVTIEGEWVEHPRHGSSFRVRTFQAAAPATQEALRCYLASGQIPGIGPTLAGAILEHFGNETATVLEETPERLTEVPGIGPARAAAIAAAWREQRTIRQIMCFLHEHNVDPILATRIYRQYGEAALETIRANPYRLDQDLPGMGFRTADALHSALGGRPDAPERIAAAVRHTLAEAAESGHIYLPVAELEARAGRLLGRALVPQVRPALEGLVRSGEAVLQDGRAYLRSLYQAEEGLARHLARLLSAPLRLPAGIARGPAGLTALSEAQRRAAVKALQCKVSVLTGGPGTGKTTAVVAVVAALERAGVPYCLCAPTGRAAKRLAEATGRRATTIHRLLAYDPATGRFGYDEDRPLPYRYIVVDEASMLDVPLACSLLRAIASDASLLLVGDADQLPSVGPGNFLADVIASGMVPVTRLVELFRQARESMIAVNAHRINAGQFPLNGRGATGSFFLIRQEDPAAAVATAVRLFKEELRFRPLSEVQVIAPMYHAPGGIVELNRALQAAVNPPRPQGAELIAAGQTFRRGDKVMQLRNNYDRGVFNGDIGRVVAVEPEARRLVVRFPGEDGRPFDVPYDAADADELMLAYAISVHKAQGSEFDSVILVLLQQHYPLLQRNLLYTAVSRARRRCIVVGSAQAVAIASSNDQARRRYSSLVEHLARFCP
jgi:exodeoxyribonuclease V alpha subunit